MVNENANLTAVLERYGLSVKLSLVASIFSGALCVLIYLAGPVYEWAGFLTFTLAAIPFTLALVYALTAFVHGKFSAAAVQDEEDKILLEKRKAGKNSILDISEDVRFTAGRTLLHFEKYVPGVIAVLSALGMAAGLFLIWKNYMVIPAGMKEITTQVPKQPLVLVCVSALAGCFSLFMGIFLSGQSHVFEFRWLRPVGAWLMAGSFSLFFSMISGILLEFELATGNSFFINLVFIILILLCAELIGSFISEFYRPRNQIEDRPVYESRLLSFFTEPGGVMRNLADSLDYQFGFKVSKTWIYGFFEKAILPALFAWAFLFWIFTGVAEVNPGEVGIREKFGAVDAKTPLLEPGIYFKLPWPMEKIVRIPVDTVHEVVIGTQFKKDGKAVKPAVVLWTSEHSTEAADILPFLVANDEGGTEVSNALSILEAAIPVNYRVKRESAYKYAYQFKDVKTIIRDLCKQEATRYFASTDFIRDMSSGRETIMLALQKRIQKESDALDLGIEILKVNFQDVHPPVKEVAPAFQDVLAAKEQAKAMIYDANAEAAKLSSEAAIRSMTIVSDAKAYRFDVSNVAAANAFRFKKQLMAYKQQGTLFRLRTYLDFLENDCKDLRKYIVSSSLPSQIYEVNMEEKPRLDLMDGADLENLGK